MNTAITDILTAQSYNKPDGTKISFTSAIDIDEARFITGIINNEKPVRTIEIGCAEGASSIVIMDALKSDNALHTIIDPFQTTYWESKGLNMLGNLGFSNYRLIEKGSEIALPELLEKGERFDFALIDGYHTFDHTLLDAFYLTRMLNIGGILLIDDVQMPAINKCIRYLYNYPCLELYGTSKENPVTTSRKTLDGIKNFVGALSSVFPRKWRYELFDGTVMAGNKKLKLRSSMLAFRKTAEDTREWNWWAPF